MRKSKWWGWCCRGVPYVLGLLLLATAGLKAFGADSLTQDSAVYSPRLLVAVIEAEVIVGLWLLSGWWARAARLTSLLFFTSLAATSLYMALTGQKDCGCFGKAHVSPWVAFGIDVAAILALLATLPARAAAESSRLSAWLRVGIAAPSLLAGAVVLGFWLAIDKPGEALARMRGDYVTVEPAITDMGEGIAKEKKLFNVTLKNHSNAPVKIVGGTASCNCLAIADLPLTLPPYGEKSVRVGMAYRGSLGQFQQKFVFYTDTVRQQTVVARFSGRVTVASADTANVK